jgi:hypothetical protein
MLRKFDTVLAAMPFVCKVPVRGRYVVETRQNLVIAANAAILTPAEPFVNLCAPTVAVLCAPPPDILV